VRTPAERAQRLAELSQQRTEENARRKAARQQANRAAADGVRAGPLSLRVRVLLEDPELTKLWLLGEKNAAAVMKGGKATRKPDFKRAEEQQRMLQAFVAQLKKDPHRKFTPTYEATAKELGCSPTHVRNVLTDLGITRDNYRRVPLG
jgi:hypothetical protein